MYILSVTFPPVYANPSLMKNISSRPRFSSLVHTDPGKLSRLHRRTALIRSLDAAPARKGLSRTLENINLALLRQLINDTDIRPLPGGPAALKSLREVCQVPDFCKTSNEENIRLLSHGYRRTSADYGVLSPDWLRR